MRLDKVGKRYGIRQPWVVRGVSMEIPPGGLVRVEGRNGSGKSTLLRIIAGAAEPSRGAVTGRPATGYVPERFPPALPFPAREYLSHVGRVHGLAGRELESRVEACLDRLGGREFARVPLRNMSKGMCQKVAVAQALLPPGSGLLVLDEAWTGLDAEAKAALDDAVAERIAGGGTVVFVDHEPGRLADLGAERWRLADGTATRVGEGVREAGDAGAASAPTPVVEIEVTGVAGGELGELPGVLSVRRSGQRVVVRAEPASSDAVLRRLLAAGDHVHVLRVDRARGYGDAPLGIGPPSGGAEPASGAAPAGGAAPAERDGGR